MKASRWLRRGRRGLFDSGRLIFLILCLSMVLASGCTFGRLQVGHPLGAGSEANLYAGQTKVEVLERLGPPDFVEVVFDESAFEYLYRENLDRELDLSIFQASFDYEQIWLRADRLIVRFDSKGRVRDFGVSRQTGAGD